MSPTEAATSALRDEVPRRLGAKKRREVTKQNFLKFTQKKLSPTEAATSALRDEVPRRLGAKKRREVIKLILNETTKT